MMEQRHLPAKVGHIMKSWNPLRISQVSRRRDPGSVICLKVGRVGGNLERKGRVRRKIELYRASLRCFNKNRTEENNGTGDILFILIATARLSRLVRAYNSSSVPSRVYA